MNIFEFKEIIDSYVEELNTGAHPKENMDIRFFIYNGDDDDIELKLYHPDYSHGIELHMRPGCSCPDGVKVYFNGVMDVTRRGVIKLKEVEE